MDDEIGAALAVADLPTEADQAGSLHEGILGHLRRYLVEGDLAEGARVPERQLCEQLGVSRTPMREALKVLASEGLVELLPNRGARVRAYSTEDVRELFEVMGGLESLAGRLACLHASQAEIQAIEALHFTMYSAYMRRDLPAYFDLNQQIHLAIVAAARNRMLEATYGNYSARIRRMRYSANRETHKDRWGEAMREHELILDALRRRDGQELSELLFGHLQNKFRAAVQVRSAENG